jgi:hypothetical protein
MSLRACVRAAVPSHCWATVPGVRFAAGASFRVLRDRKEEEGTHFAARLRRVRGRPANQAEVEQLGQRRIDEDIPGGFREFAVNEIARCGRPDDRNRQRDGRE